MAQNIFYYCNMFHAVSVHIMAKLKGTKAKKHDGAIQRNDRGGEKAK